MVGLTGPGSSGAFSYCFVFAVYSSTIHGLLLRGLRATLRAAVAGVYLRRRRPKSCSARNGRAKRRSRRPLRSPMSLGIRRVYEDRSAVVLLLHAARNRICFALGFCCVKCRFSYR